MTLNKDQLKCQLIRGAYIFKEWLIYVTTLTFSLLAIFRCNHPHVSWVINMCLHLFSIYICLYFYIYMCLKFYIYSAATFCFLVPLLIEPALATLQHKFIQTNCSTISGETFILKILSILVPLLNLTYMYMATEMTA